MIILTLWSVSLNLWSVNFTWWFVLFSDQSHSVINLIHWSVIFTRWSVSFNDQSPSPPDGDQLCWSVSPSVVFHDYAILDFMQCNRKNCVQWSSLQCLQIQIVFAGRFVEDVRLDSTEQISVHTDRLIFRENHTQGRGLLEGRERVRGIFQDVNADSRGQGPAWMASHCRFFLFGCTTFSTCQCMTGKIVHLFSLKDVSVSHSILMSAYVETKTQQSVLIGVCLCAWWMAEMERQQNIKVSRSDWP